MVRIFFGRDGDRGAVIICCWLRKAAASWNRASASSLVAIGDRAAPGPASEGGLDDVAVAVAEGTIVAMVAIGAARETLVIGENEEDKDRSS